MNPSARTGAFPWLLCTLLLIAGCAAPVDPSPAPPNAVQGSAIWRPIPASPLSARHSAHAFWTDTEVLILGGDGATPPCPGECILTPELLRDGAALDLRAGTWRELNPAPVPLGYLTGAIVADDLYLLVPEARPAGPDHGAFLGYRIAEDRWEELPAPAGPAQELVLLAAGSRLVAYRSSQEAPGLTDQVYDPALRAWSELPLDPLAPAFDRAIVWTGRDLVVLGIHVDATRAPNEAPLNGAAALDPAGGDWRRLPDSEVTVSGPTWFWTGPSIVNPSIGSADGGQVNNWGRSYPYGGLLTPPATWSSLPDLPAGPGEFAGLSVGGPDYAVSTEGWVLHVPTRSWIRLTKPPKAPDEGAAVTWAGDRLLVWGGISWNGEKATLLDVGWEWLPGGIPAR